MYLTKQQVLYPFNDRQRHERKGLSHNGTNAMNYVYHYDSPLGGIDKKERLLELEKLFTPA